MFSLIRYPLCRAVLTQRVLCGDSSGRSRGLLGYFACTFTYPKRGLSRLLFIYFPVFIFLFLYGSVLEKEIWNS